MSKSIQFSIEVDGFKRNYSLTAGNITLDGHNTLFNIHDSSGKIVGNVRIEELEKFIDKPLKEKLRSSFNIPS